MGAVIAVFMYWTSAVIATAGIIVALRGFTPLATAQQRSIEQSVGASVAALGVLGLLLTKAWLDRIARPSTGAPRRRVPLIAAGLALVWTFGYLVIWAVTTGRELGRAGIAVRETGWSVTRTVVLTLVSLGVFVDSLFEPYPLWWQMSILSAVVLSVAVLDAQLALDRYWRKARPELRPNVTPTEWVALGGGAALTVAAFAVVALGIVNKLNR